MGPVHILIFYHSNYEDYTPKNTDSVRNQNFFLDSFSWVAASFPKFILQGHHKKQDLQALHGHLRLECLSWSCIGLSEVCNTDFDMYWE